MIVLGLESTAHTFGAAIIEDKKVLSNVKDIFTTEKGGLIPARVADHHVENFERIIKDSLKKSGKSLDQIGLVSFSISPGFGAALRVGAFVARSISLRYKVPVMGVNHCIAHLEIGRMLFPNCKDPVLLYASGANTQIIAYDGGKYRIFGETLDMGVGNFIDSFARYLGLGFPGGPKIEKLAKAGRNYIDIPYCVKGMDVNFGGILTNLQQKYDSGKYSKEDLCYSLQETVFAMLVEVSERAMAHCEKSELLIGGGVGCNKRFQEMCSIMCSERDGKFYAPENQFLVDNAAMIAWLGLVEYEGGVRMTVEESGVRPYERTDEVDVIWR